MHSLCFLLYGLQLQLSPEAPQKVDLYPYHLGEITVIIMLALFCQKVSSMNHGESCGPGSLIIINVD